MDTRREAAFSGAVEGGEDPGVLPGHAARLRRQQPAAAQVLFRKVARNIDRAALAGQHELRDVLLAQSSKQEAAAVPRGDLGHSGRGQHGRLTCRCCARHRRRPRSTIRASIAPTTQI